MANILVIDDDRMIRNALVLQLIQLKHTVMVAETLTDGMEMLPLRNEENYMERINYEALEEHKQCHAELVERLNEVITQNNGINDLVHKLKRLMVVWVIEHIIHEDRKIAQLT